MEIKKSNKKLDKEILEIIILSAVFAVFFILNLLINIPFLLQCAIFGVIYIYAAFDIFKKCLKEIKEFNFLNEEFLMCLASLGSFALGIWTGVKNGKPEGFDEACAVIILYRLGEWFSQFAVRKSKSSIARVMDMRPEFVNLIKGEEIIKVAPEDVNIGDMILVKVGERIPLDGVVKKGESTLDNRSLTGEALPMNVQEGDEVLSGSINLTSGIVVEVKKCFSQSTVSKIIDLMENARERKTKSENFITRFARIYTPLVVIGSFLLMIIPPLINMILQNESQIGIWVYRGLCFLIVSCPCALVLSVPLAYFQGLGCASKRGILVKGSVFLEKISKADVFAFDKTGTLTNGKFDIVDIQPKERKHEILCLALQAEKDLNHPISKSIILYCQNNNIRAENDDYTVKNIQGRGAIARSSECEIIVGNKELMEEYKVDIKESKNGNCTKIYVAKNGEYIGSIALADLPKNEAKEVVSMLNKTASTIMLTGDREENAIEVSKKIGIMSHKSSLLPQDKCKEIETLQKKGNIVAFTGDGINDSAALALSEIGLSMGNISSDSAIEASDVVILNDDLRKILTLRKIATKTQKIVLENTIFSIAIKAVILLLSSIGVGSIWFAVFADVGVLILAISNTFRIRLVKNN